MKHVGLFAFILLALWLIYAAVPKTRLPEPEPPPIVLTPAEDLAAAKDMLKNKKPLNAADIGTIQKHLRSIAPTLPEHKEVPALLKQTDAHEQRLIKELAAKLRAEGIADRQRYVEKLETEYLNKGYDVHLSATGPQKTIFTFKFVLVSRPLVHQLINSDSFMGSLRSRGFEKAIFTDGYSGGWTVDVNK